MKRLLFAIALVLLVGSFSNAAAQACGSHAVLKGCMDAPAFGSTVYQSNWTAVSGWSVSTVTKQQGDKVEVYISGVGPLPQSQYVVAWRGYRPDVAAAYGTQTQHLGYTLWIAPGVLPLGNNVVIAVNFSCGASGFGIDSQQTNVTVQ